MTIALALQTVSWFIVCLTTITAYGRFVGTLRGFWGLSPSWSAEAFGTLWCLLVAGWGTCGALQRPSSRRHQLLGALFALCLCGAGVAIARLVQLAPSFSIALREVAPHVALVLALPALGLLVWLTAAQSGSRDDGSVRLALASQVAGMLLFFLRLGHGSEFAIVCLLVVMPALLYARSCAYHMMARPIGWRLRACLGLLAALLSSVPAL
ncbi:MAG TPA: hypothetical protein VGI70_21895 [Polyangiales bacterium]|jgi:hypothetical protein